MKRTDVSVVLPVYNTGKTAKKIIKRLLDSYESIEIIVVDDGSSDDSVDYLRAIKDSRVSIYSKKNAGPSSSRNYGIEKARGTYLMFVDSDDDVKRDYIKKMIEAMDKTTVMAVCGLNYYKVDDGSKEKVYLNDFPYKKNEGNKDLMLRSLWYDGRMYPVFNKIFKTEIVKKNNIKYDESMSFGEDTKFVMDYLDIADGKINFVLEPLYVYYSGTSTSTARRSQGLWSNWRKCYSNLRRWIGEKPTWRQRRLLALIYLKWRASWIKTKFKF